jgi:cell division protein FtsB|tara:strand:+ start:64 stop:453 length:390 start_codon:yes stop_codon:yes gene_type:complete
MNCTKVSFASEKDANEHIQRIKEKSGRRVLPTRAYACNKCPNYHLTSQPNWVELTKTLEGKIVVLKDKVQDLETRNATLRVGDLGKLAKKNQTQKATITQRDETIKKLNKTNGELMQNLIKANVRNNTK